MATVLKTNNKRRVLVGVITEIEEAETLYRIKVTFEENQEALSEVPKKEFRLLGIKLGDEVQLLPVDSDSYLLVGNP